MLFSSSGGPSWLVVFLGNPGPKYDFTRHNAGFLVCDTLAKKKGFAVNRLRFNALTAQVDLGGEKALVMKPQTFMNLSGNAVGQAVRFYKIPADHVLVVSDEVSLPPGKLRIRTKGSAGGHNGLKSIIAARAPPHPDYDMADWVLGVFRDQDALDMQSAAERAAEAVESYIKDGPERAMNRFN